MGADPALFGKSGPPERAFGSGSHGERTFNGYAIARVPQGLLNQVSGLREIQYIEKPKRLFFAMDMAKAASLSLGIQPGRREEEGHLERSRADIRVVWSVDLREKG